MFANYCQINQVRIDFKNQSIHKNFNHWIVQTTKRGDWNMQNFTIWELSIFSSTSVEFFSKSNLKDSYHELKF